MLNKLHIGDAREIMKVMIAFGVKAQTIITSPPYWGLRDYQIPPVVWADGWEGCLGLEPDIWMYLEHMAEIFRLVWNVLADDGVLWVNMGDCYAAGKPRLLEELSDPTNPMNRSNRQSYRRDKRPREDDPHKAAPGLNPKNLIGMPWRVAFRLQEEGWYLRRDIVWWKRNSMPESVKDRPHTAHEYVFMFTKGERYYYDHEAVKLPASPDTHARYGRARGAKHKYSDTDRKLFKGPGLFGGTRENVKYNVPSGWDTSTGEGRHGTSKEGRYPGVNPKCTAQGSGTRQNASFSGAVKDVVEMRALRSVWDIPSVGFPGPHYATFPPDLVKPCLLAGSRKGDVVFDPFMGSGTVAQVAELYGRQWIGCDMDPKSLEHLLSRTRQGILISP